MILERKKEIAPTNRIFGIWASHCFLACFPWDFPRTEPAIREVPITGGSTQDDNAGYKRDLHSYLWGISLALALTVVPFGLVYWSVLPRFALLLTIGAFALTQIVVHFRFFLHIDPPRQKVDDLQLILFSCLILFSWRAAPFGLWPISPRG